MVILTAVTRRFFSYAPRTDGQPNSRDPASFSIGSCMYHLPSVSLLELTLTTTMAFNSLLAQVGNLLQSDATVDDSMPCKSDILAFRECSKEGAKKCEGLRLDLMQCMAKYYVDTTEKVRVQIGIASYNEYVKELEEKHGKEKAASIIAEPVEKLKNVEAAQMMYRISNNQHPKGAPKTKADLATWTYADQVRLEMGEKAYWDAVQVVGAEFGAEKVDRLFGVSEEAKTVGKALERLAPGADVKGLSAKTMEKFNTMMEPVREKAPENATVDDLAAAFKKIYPTKASLDAKLA